MDSVGERLSDLPSGTWLELQHVVKRFEHAWHLGPRPAIDDYLPVDGEGRGAILVELVHADLELRIKAGEGARVEEYLERYPELAGERVAMHGLVTAEYEFRRRLRLNSA